MTDPYKILGVSPSDSDEQIKSKYRELVKKYHPDNYSQSPMMDIAEEKMAEINNAFDEVMNMRRGGTSFDANSQNSNNYNYSNPSYFEIRRLIQAGNATVADEMLEKMDTSSRDAEWFFLKGSVCYTRGWLNDAYENFATASNLEPNNAEYKAALNQMQNNRQGFMNGNPNQNYRTNPNVSGCNSCDMCSSLICADCCCECAGGDLIGCC